MKLSKEEVAILMLILKVDTVDPFINLAIEEYLTTSDKYIEPILYLWQNKNTIVVGRNQNPASEINLQNAWEDKISVIRRNTGGGTVFHDLGNLNFSIIYTDIQNNGVVMFEKMLEPIIKTLNQMGILAKFSGRNDIVLNGKKISGNAMWKYQDRFLQHGTILFNSDLDKLEKYLTVDRAKILSKNIDSIRARVTNINSEIEKPLEISEFIEKLIDTYSKEENVHALTLDKKDFEEISKISETKYLDPNWTYKKNATFTYENKVRLEGKGSFEIYLDVHEGVINDCRIYGDFLGFVGTEDFEKKLIGKNYQVEELKKIIYSCQIKDIFGVNINEQDVLDLLIQ